MALVDVVSPQLSVALARRLGVPDDVGYVLAPALTLSAALLAGYVAEAFLLRGLRALAARSSLRLDDVFANALHGPVRLFALLLGACLAVMLTPAPLVLRVWADRAFVVLSLATVVVTTARVLGGIVAVYGDRAAVLGASRALARRLVVTIVYLVGFLFILDNQGVSITPLLTTLGLAGLAVALALQDTLSNFFAGIWVQADRPVDVGHYVRVEDLNVEGFVVQVGWRTTKIRTLPNNYVVIPNSRLAQSVVTDYDLPEPRMSLLVNIPVAPGADSQKVERILVEEAKLAAKDVPGLLAEPEPFVRFIPGFTEKGLEFTLICQVKTFVDQYLAQHELRHRLMQRLAREGIALSYPIRTLRVEGAREVPVAAAHHPVQQGQRP